MIVMKDRKEKLITLVLRLTLMNYTLCCPVIVIV